MPAGAPSSPPPVAREPAGERGVPAHARTGLGVGAGLLGAALSVLGLLVLVRVQGTGLWVAAFLAPILLVASLPALARQASRERDPALLWILVAALVLKLGGAMVRYYVGFTVYEGFVDARMYHEHGTELAMKFRAGEFDTGLAGSTGTDFIRLLTGIIYTVTGPSIYAGFLIYSWLAFWGMFLLYRAFTIAIPGGIRHSYALLLFFLPSMLYWPSSIGKEAWMLFTLGLAALGGARILRGQLLGGAWPAALGLYLGALCRPHVAGMAALGLVVGYLLGRPRRDLGWRGPVLKVASSAVLLALALFVLQQTATYLRDKGIEPQEGVQSVLNETGRRTTQGDSTFEAPVAAGSPAQMLARLPVATVTILFRPFLFEAHNLQAGVTALESTLLLWLTLARRRRIWRGIRSARNQPYAGFVLAYMALFIVAFSSIANFGILARERVQVLPFLFVLLAFPATSPFPPRRPAGQPAHRPARAPTRRHPHAASTP